MCKKVLVFGERHQKHLSGTQVCRAGDAGGQKNLARCIEIAGVAQSDTEAVKWYRDAEQVMFLNN